MPRPMPLDAPVTIAVWCSLLFEFIVFFFRFASLFLHAVNIDNSLCKGLWGFLRQIVPNAAGDDSVRIFAREFLSIGASGRVGCAIGITFKGNCRYGND